MLPSKKDISESNPPYLLKYPTGEWSLVSEIIYENSMQKLKIVYLKAGEFKQRVLEVESPLFYVGADIWELEFGSILMTLDHPTLHDHPAMNVWNQWLSLKNDCT